MIRHLFIFLLILAGPELTNAQCEVSERVFPDGTMYYRAETLLFYRTASFQLSGHIVTDKENYFLGLSPLPFPEKTKGSKIKNDLTVVLKNDTTYTLKFYDSDYKSEDTSFSMLFIFSKKDLDAFKNNEVKEVKLNLGEGESTYVFRLHSDAIKIQLACFTKPKNKF